MAPFAFLVGLVFVLAFALVPTAVPILVGIGLSPIVMAVVAAMAVPAIAIAGVAEEGAAPAVPRSANGPAPIVPRSAGIARRRRRRAGRGPGQEQAEEA